MTGPNDQETAPSKHQQVAVRRPALRRQFFRYVLPSLAAMVAYTFYTLVDGYFVARYVGKVGLGSVNLAMPFVNSFFALGIFFAIGTQVVCSYHLGSDNRAEADRVFSLAFKAALIIAPLLAMISFLLTPQIARLLGAKGDYFPLVEQYLRYILIFAPCFILAYLLEIMIKADGHPQLAIGVELVAAATNIGLDWYFVGQIGLGIRGAAMATGIAQVVMLAIYLFHFLACSSRLHLHLRVAFDFPLLGRIIGMGIGDFFSEIGVGLTIFFYNSFILYYFGHDLLPIYSVISYLNLFVVSCFLGVAQGAQPLFSYYCGQQDRQSSRRLVYMSAAMVIGLAVLAYVVCLIFGPRIFGIFFELTNEELATALPILHILTLTYFFAGPNVLMASHAVAHMQAKASMWIHLSRTTLFVLVYLFLCTWIDKAALWWAAPLAELTTFFTISLPVFRQRSSYWTDLSERNLPEEASGSHLFEDEEDEDEEDDEDDEEDEELQNIWR